MALTDSVSVFAEGTPEGQVYIHIGAMNRGG